MNAEGKPLHHLCLRCSPVDTLESLREFSDRWLNYAQNRYQLDDKLVLQSSSLVLSLLYMSLNLHSSIIPAYALQ